MSDAAAPVQAQDGTAKPRGFLYEAVEGGPGHALDVLSSWSVLEALSPTTYVEPRDLSEGGWTTLGPLRESRLPWNELEIPRENYVFYHRLCLGSIDMRLASRALLEAYGQDEGRENPRGNHAVLAMALVDAKGVPVNKSLSVSSFAWALPLVLRQELGDMGRWDETESDVLTHVAGLMTHADPDDPEKVAPVKWADVMAAHHWLVKRFGLPPEFVQPPSFSLRVEHRRKARSEPGPYLLNSFYLRDIETAATLVEKGQAPQALRGYLGIDAPGKPIDILQSRIALRSVLSPRYTPNARWPAPGGHALVTLQQAAANAANYGLVDEGILSVNGPPGTGKTTLLRDVVAACVLRRATAMAGFEDPRDAFTAPVAEDGKRQGRKPYRLHPSLVGHEVLVASSNNKAVENISRELPLAKAVGRPDLGMRYFRTLSDALAGITADPRKAHENEGRERTWGLAAAALGNAENRHRFMQTFWWDEDHGIRTWLRLAQGQKVTVHVKDKKGRLLESRAPHLIAAESPPMRQVDAMARWTEVRTRFRALEASVDRDAVEVGTFQWALDHVDGVRSDRAAAAAKVAALSEAPSDLDVLTVREADGLDDLRKAEAALAALAGAEPSPAGGQAWTLWDIEREEAAHAIDGLRRRLERLSGRIREARASAGPQEPGRADLLSARVDLARLECEVRACEEVIARMAPATGDRAVDAAFFERGHESWNKATPWYTDALQARREDLFAAAMEVHEAFVLAAADRLQPNLSAFAEMMGANGVPAELSDHVGDLWSSLFLVVPVVSTTFASVGRMLGAMPPATLGWLVVDEAGQAMPQAAVGALMRCRRAVVVGDPWQIEPVSLLPRRLAVRICRHHGVDPNAWTGPSASAQTLADVASPLKAVLGGAAGAREVGMPLLVHRRCQEPMFGISNRVAYAGQMVFASLPGGTSVGASLGPSAWFDVTGPHQGKFCHEQGEAVAGLLRRLAADGGQRPDVYVISPFREVVVGLQRRLMRETRLFQSLGEDANDWVRSRVGTIHTFQGREAEAVLLVLGAGTGDDAGARSWAGATPNIVNVAVSRAKANLYVVGCREAWSGVGAIAEMSAHLPGGDAPRSAPPRQAPAMGRFGLAALPRKGLLDAADGLVP